MVNFSKFFSENFHSNGKNGIVSKLDLPEDENKIFQVLQNKWALDLASLIQETSLDADTLMTHLTMLEINNYICQQFPGVYNILINN